MSHGCVCAVLAAVRLGRVGTSPAICLERTYQLAASVRVFYNALPTEDTEQPEICRVSVGGVEETRVCKTAVGKGESSGAGEHCHSPVDCRKLAQQLRS